MSFKRFDPEDFLISGDSLIGPAWSGDTALLPAVSVINSGISATYYKTGGSGNTPQFSVSVGIKGDAVDERNVTYRQFANIILGDSDSTFVIAGSEITSCSFITVERARFKGSIYPNTFGISGSVGDCDVLLSSSAHYISDANITSTVTFNNGGRMFNLIPSGASDASGAKGLLLPDIGVAILSGSSSGSSGANYDPLNDDTVTKLAGHMTCNSQETLTSAFAFVRARNSEFNYSQNPTFIDSTTGGVRFTDFINAPQTFITTVGLYNDNNDLLAVAKLSKPLKKDFTKEALIRVKLDF